MTARTDPWIDVKSLTLFGFFVLLGGCVMLFPLAALILVVVTCAGALVFYLVHGGYLRVWQLLALMALTGYMILNYGFENISLHLGSFPIILGHSMMFAALGLAVIHYRHIFRQALAEPAMRWMLGLIALTCLHLVYDISHYGLYALRDASLTLEGIFMLLGLLWATESRNTLVLMRWLFCVWLLLTLYAYLYPWAEALRGVSPVSGIFQPVPIVGYYSGTAFRTTVGALFCICAGKHVVKQRWLLLLLAAAQIYALAFLQLRAMYIGVVLALAIFLFFGEIRKWAQLSLVLLAGLAGLVVLTSVGLQMEGRVGPVNAAFIKEHAESLLGTSTAPAEGTIESRKDWYKQVEKRLVSSASNLIVGVGFGQPLIQFSTSNNAGNQDVEVRQPHNSHLTFLARLGLVGGTIWLLLNLYIIWRFVSTLRRRAFGDARLRDLTLWLFLFYLLDLLESAVQPGLEFSSGAITFYFLTGFALGLIRWQVQPRAQVNRQPSSPSLP